MPNAVEINGLRFLTKLFGTVICGLVISGVVGIWIMVIDVSSLKTGMISFDQRLGRIEYLIDNSRFSYREDR